MTEALLLAAADFKVYHAQEVCSVCRGEKWTNAPFCRLCSIRLQRANMMSKLKDLLWQNRRAKDLKDCTDYLIYYDMCRDYLISRRRGAE